MAAPGEQPSDRSRAFAAARRAARLAAFNLARDADARIITRPAFRGSHASVQDAEPLAGMRAARDVEIAARQTAHDYIRAAREAGYSWHDIGIALELQPGADAQQAGETVAEAAYTYAAGSPDSEFARRYGRSFSWTCASCDGLILDHGLCNGPADDERGHARGCRRLASATLTLEAEWEAGE